MLHVCPVQYSLIFFINYFFCFCEARASCTVLASTSFQQFTNDFPNQFSSGYLSGNDCICSAHALCYVFLINELRIAIHLFSKGLSFLAHVLVTYQKYALSVGMLMDLSDRVFLCPKCGLTTAIMLNTVCVDYQERLWAASANS